VQTHIWRNVRVELPGDWEMLQFSRDPAAGRCAFADRHQFRLEFTWRAVPGPPDLGRMVSDYRAKLETEPGTTDVWPAAVGSWSGVEARRDGQLTSRFGGYLATEGCVVEVVFLWPEGRDGALEGAVLGSLRAEAPLPDGSRRWRAFGMDLAVSAGLALAEARVEAARASLTFAGPRVSGEESFQRLGLVSEWLDGSVAEWLAAQVRRGGRVDSQASVEVHGHDVALLAGRRPVRRWGGLVTRLRPFEAAAWVCPAHGRLYCVCGTGALACESQPGPALSEAEGAAVPHAPPPAQRLAGGRLASCEALRLTRDA
jgi:hypothetical protein